MEGKRKKERASMKERVTKHRQTRGEMAKTRSCRVRGKGSIRAGKKRKTDRERKSERESGPE